MIFYSDYIKHKFGFRVQKIALNSGLSCPNRDGKISFGGCTYCDNNTFSPFYGQSQKSINQQLTEGISFFAKKYKTQKYIAYFQSYTNTYSEISKLENIYESALSHPDVVGLSVATRPDCVDDKTLSLLQKYSKKVYTTIEFGVESCYNDTLKRINRGHNFDQAKDAIERANSYGLEVCVHLIMFLPKETEKMMLQSAKILQSLPIKILKLHQLQIIKGTKMEDEYKKFPQDFNLPSAEEYLIFCQKFIKLCNKNMIFERFISESPKNLVIAPKWDGLKNYEFVEKLKKKLQEK